jgi:hypothetical protein
VAGAFVVGRRNDLARAVRNLLDNAQHHAASAVTIGLGNGDGTVSPAVDDDGPGVPPNDRDRIFERFARLDGARTRDGGRHRARSRHRQGDRSSATVSPSPCTTARAAPAARASWSPCRPTDRALERARVRGATARGR